MAVLAIPNPKKSTQVDFPIERVKMSVLNIGLINNKYKFSSSNEIFNQYTYEALEFLSLGVFIDINLNKLGEEKTEIIVEVRRKIGTFNQSHEVTNANNHLVKIFELIANLTAMNIEEIENLKSQKNIQKTNPAKQSYNNSEEKRWYDKTWLVAILCIIFFPVGLYALWKNSSISKGWKTGITILISLIVLANISSNNKTSNTVGNQNVVETQKSNTTEAISSTHQDENDAIKDEIIEKLKSKAGRDWPNDYTTQEFWVNQQIEDYEYMLTIEDNSIKSQAQQDFPLDFTTQKFWYNQQIDAQERMK